MEAGGKFATNSILAIEKKFNLQTFIETYFLTIYPTINLNFFFVRDAYKYLNGNTGWHLANFIMIRK